MFNPSSLNDFFVYKIFSLVSKYKLAYQQFKENRIK